MKSLWSRADLAVLLTLVVVIGAELTAARNYCPAKLAPCTCSPKSKGLVLICEKTTMEEIQKNMQVFKELNGVVIQYLTLRQTHMPRIQDYIFMGLDIRHLIVSSTNLAVLEEHSLSALSSKLEILDLSQNMIHDVPTRAIKYLGHTRFLTVNHNNITSIGPGAFDGMHSLDRLALYANSINRIDRDAFRGIENITYLNLGGNHLQKIPISAISKLTNLVILELQENKIQSISENEFAGLSNLDTLKLGHNQISVLGPNVFRNLPRMSLLDLEFNKISKIDNAAFRGLEEKLEWLKMGHNSVKEIPSEALKGMHRLREFDFKVNNIAELKEDAFEGFGRTIKFLYLQNNRIDLLPMSVFAEMHSLEHISLANNKVKHMPRDVFQPIIENVQVIDVHDNDLICDCKLLWYKQWLTRSMSSNYDKVKEISLKTQCWMTNPKHQYTLTKAPIEKVCPTDSGSLRTIGNMQFHLIMLAFTWTMSIYTFN